MCVGVVWAWERLPGLRPAHQPGCRARRHVRGGVAAFRQRKDLREAEGEDEGQGLAQRRLRFPADPVIAAASITRQTMEGSDAR